MSSTEQLATLKDQLQGEADNPVTLDPDVFQGLFADKLFEHLEGFREEAEKMATAAATLAEIKQEQDAADAALAAAPSEDDVAQAYQKYLDSFEDEDSDGTETRKLLQEWKDLKAERDDAVEEHRKKCEELTKRYRAAMEGIGGDETDDEKSDTWRDGGDEDTPKRTGGGFDADDASKRSMSEDDFDALMGGGETQLSSDTPTAAQPTSTMMPTAAQQQPTASAMPTAASSPAFSPSPSVSPQRKDKDRERKSERDVEPLPLPGVVSTTSTTLDRGSFVNGATTTKDVSGKGGTIGLTNAAPGSTNPGSNPRGGGMVGGMPMGGHGANPIGAGGKSTTAAASKILDADRTLTRREDNDVSISGGTVSRDTLDIFEKQAEEEEDKISRLNTAADKRKAS